MRPFPYGIGQEKRPTGLSQSSALSNIFQYLIEIPTFFNERALRNAPFTKGNRTLFFVREQDEEKCVLWGWP